MLPRRNQEGWRYIGQFHFKVSRQDNFGDQSTTTTLEMINSKRNWSLDLMFTRGWKYDEEGERP
jgi:hypothetical protein